MAFKVRPDSPGSQLFPDLSSKRSRELSETLPGRLVPPTPKWRSILRDRLNRGGENWDSKIGSGGLGFVMFLEF